MSDAKITELVELLSPAGTDMLAIVDLATGETKKVQRANLLRKSPTLHFHRSDVGTVTPAPIPGTYDVDAASAFIQLNVANDEVIEAVHLHVQKGGTGVDLGFDIFRYRASEGHTFLVHVGLAGTVVDDQKAFAVPAGVLTDLEAGDYLKCQPTALTLGGIAGVTIDVHFATAP